MNETPVTFNSMGQQVVGMWHRPLGRGPFPAVLFLHGFTGHKSEAHRIFVEQARVLAAAGIAALRFDFRGCGDSAGDFSRMTIAGERADARAALRFLKRRREIDADRVGLLGFSMGGLVGVYTLADEPALRAAVLWNPVAFPRDLRDQRVTPEGGRQVRKLGVLDNGGWAVGAEYLKELGVLDPVARAAAIHCPVLLLGSTKDETVPIAHATAYRDALRGAGTPVSFHAVEGADHTFGSLGWTAEALAVTLNWFRARLSP